VRLLLQRVTEARVRRVEDGAIVGEIPRGLLVLLGVGPDDGAAEVAWACGRLRTLRLFDDGAGKMNFDLAQAGGAVLVVSQFTLYAEVSGRRPGFSRAAAPEHARAVYHDLIAALRAEGVRVERGAFGEAMHVESINDGPVTLWLER
jgi:D-aminoacyl-tRNA deacylase